MNYTNRYLADLERIRGAVPDYSRLSGSRVLITGAGGLICSALVDFLMSLDLDIQIWVAGRSVEKLCNRFSHWGDGLNYLRYDALENEKVPTIQYSTSQELEVYRRAERIERVAKERAEQVYHQVNGALADATIKVDSAFAQLGDLTAQLSSQLAQLEDAVTGSREALAEATEVLYTIRPTGDIR
jgi:hypothetical protein